MQSNQLKRVALVITTLAISVIFNERLNADCGPLTGECIDVVPATGLICQTDIPDTPYSIPTKHSCNDYLIENDKCGRSELTLKKVPKKCGPKITLLTACPSS